MSARLLPYAALMLFGIGWGASIPLSKIAVSAGHMPLGLIFWQFVIGVVLLGAMIVARGSFPRITAGSLRLFVLIAFIGTILPNYASYSAAVHVPGYALAICIAAVPMFAFPIAIAIGNERFSILRFLGLISGMAGVAILVLPEASLPDKMAVSFIPVALAAPFFYGIEGNYIAKFGTLHHTAIETLWGASLIGMIVVLPLTLWSGQWINPMNGIGTPELALVASAVLHALVYAGYVWLVARVGATFAAQVSYFVTLFGVAWSVVLLNESLTIYLFVALGFMLIGMALVSPKKTDA
ncbi:MAG: DMT family transporter [Paracoccaceae bacterium]|jgi:drug/metabolite transporter (DMT)-like permease